MTKSMLPAPLFLIQEALPWRWASSERDALEEGLRRDEKL
jgi:hypothetical protein